DLLLLSIRERTGLIATSARIGYGLMGSELVRLAARGRIQVESKRIVVLDASPTGDSNLDAALGSIAASKRPPRAKSWVGTPRKKIKETYLGALTRSGSIEAERGRIVGVIPVTRWRIRDPGRIARARSRFDTIASGTGPVGAEDAAYGGLAH